MYLTASRPDIMFAVCAYARFQVTPKVSHLHALKRIFRYLKGKKQTIISNSTIEAKYVATANCYRQVLWIQNQMLDYGFNFMNTKIHIDNESTICIVKNLVFHSKTKHIEIRHHFIRDSYEKRLIQVIKIHKDHNVDDLLTKAFDVNSDEFGVKTGSCKVNAARQDLVLLGEIISESSVRSNLYFNDEDGVTSLTNFEILENLALMGYEIVSDKLTFQKAFFSPQWKDSYSIISKYVGNTSSGGEGPGQPSEAQPPPSPAPPSHEVQASTVASPPQKTHTPRQAKRGEDDRVVRAATIATSLEAEQEKVNTSRSGEDSIEHQDDLMDLVPPTPHDSPLSGEHTLGSDEGKPNINELMVICTKLSNLVLAMETSKTTQDLVIKKLKRKVKRLDKKLRARTLGMKLFKISTSRRKSLDKENNVKGDTVNDDVEVNTATTRVSTASASVTTAGVSISTAEPRTPPTTTTTAFEDEDLTIAQTLVKMRSEKDKVKGVNFRDVEESARSTTILPTIDPKDKGKGIMQELESLQRTL
ncbi:hypothetical protein Tco_0200976 [Tanacetum coccineum]